MRADPLLGRRRRSSKGEGTPSPGLDRHLIYQVAPPPPLTAPSIQTGVFGARAFRAVLCIPRRRADASLHRVYRRIRASSLIGSLARRPLKTVAPQPAPKSARER